MKNLALCLTLGTVVLSACGTSTAPSSESKFSPRRSVEYANLEKVHLDPELNVGKQYGASIEVDHDNKQVTLQIMTCPPNATCIWSGPSYNASIQSIVTNPCRERVIKARHEGRPVGGDLVEITVVDASKSICETPYTYATKVELDTRFYSRMAGGEVATHSEMTGEKALALMRFTRL